MNYFFSKYVTTTFLDHGDMQASDISQMGMEGSKSF